MHLTKSTDFSSIAGNHKKLLNKNYEEDFKMSQKYSRRFLKLIGLWQIMKENPSTTDKLISKLLTIVCFMGILFTLIPMTADAIIRKNSALVKLSRFLGRINATLAIFFKYIIIIHRREKIGLCIKHIERDWMEVETENEREIMLKNVRVSRQLTIIACVIMYSSTTFFFIIQTLVIGTTINERNETIRPVVYPGFDMFVNPQKSPAYEIIYWGLIIASCIRYTITMTSFNLAASFVCHACGQIQIVLSRLQCLFDEITEEQYNEKIPKRLSSIIHRHVRGLRFSTYIDNVLQEMCLVEVVSVTILIGFLEYTIQNELKNAQLVTLSLYAYMLCAWTFNIFIFCYIGDILKEQFEEVGRSTYLIEWYRFPNRTGLAIVMIIAMANVPRKLTAGRIFDLSMATFSTIIKTSVAYLNIMTTMSD